MLRISNGKLSYQARSVKKNIYMYCSTLKQALNTTAQQFRGSKQLPTMLEMQRAAVHA